MLAVETQAHKEKGCRRADHHHDGHRRTVVFGHVEGMVGLGVKNGGSAICDRKDKSRADIESKDGKEVERRPDYIPLHLVRSTMSGVHATSQTDIH